MGVVVVDEFTVPGLAALVEGKRGDDESGDRVEPAGANAFGRADTEQG